MTRPISPEPGRGPVIGVPENTVFPTQPGIFRRIQNRAIPVSMALRPSAVGTPNTVLPLAYIARNPTINVTDWANCMIRVPMNALHHTRAMPSVNGVACPASARGATAARSITNATRMTNPNSRPTRSTSATRAMTIR